MKPTDITRLRLAAGMSIRDLARAAKVAESSLGEMEAGKKRIPTHMALRIADALGLGPEAVLGGDE